MASFSTHVLNSSDGSHVSGVSVSLFEVAADGERKIVFEAETDDGGRLSFNFQFKNESAIEYEVMAKVPDWFTSKSIPNFQIKKTKFLSITLRVRFSDPKGAYHIPLLVSPFGFSGWISG